MPKYRCLAVCDGKGNADGNLVVGVELYIIFYDTFGLVCDFLLQACRG